VAEEALRSAHEQLADRAVQLEKLVEERTANLQKMINELEYVSYSITHDMRAPLRAMTAFATILSDSASENLTAAEAKDYLQRILAAASRFDKLIQDALHYTKVVQQEMPMQPVHLGKLVRGLLESYPNLQPDRADIRVEGELPVVHGNETLLTQCFSNLLGNAVKFVGPGTKPVVRVRAETRDGTAKIWVEDNGIDIPPNAQSRLFKMFQKLDSHYEGTGIGLAIVRKVAERMGGKVGAESEEGKGSRFWVELPVASEGSNA
jgi:signal transduction histidine kinase